MNHGFCFSFSSWLQESPQARPNSRRGRIFATSDCLLERQEISKYKWVNCDTSGDNIDFLASWQKCCVQQTDLGDLIYLVILRDTTEPMVWNLAKRRGRLLALGHSSSRCGLMQHLIGRIWVVGTVLSDSLAFVDI